MKQKKTKINTLEIYSQWYLQELKDAGYLIDFKREPETLEVLPKLKHSSIKRFIKKPNEALYFNLFQDITYTYDYKLIWAEKARYIFYDLISSHSAFEYGKPPFIAVAGIVDNDHASRIDVKPTTAAAQKGGNVSSLYTFPLKQRIIYENTGIYIQKFIPIPVRGTGMTISIFPNTFTPQRYLLTDGGGMVRKIKFPIVTLSQFVQSRMKYIESENLLNKPPLL